MDPAGVPAEDPTELVGANEGNIETHANWCALSSHPNSSALTGSSTSCVWLVVGPVWSLIIPPAVEDATGHEHYHRLPTHHSDAQADTLISSVYCTGVNTLVSTVTVPLGRPWGEFVAIQQPIAADCGLCTAQRPTQ